jgi:hypothetical protein
METPTPSQPNQPLLPVSPSGSEPTAPSPPDRDRDLETLGGLEAEFTEMEHELDRVDRPGADSAGADSAGAEAPVS